MRIRRFTPVQKAFHLLLLATFLLQAATGMARMYIETEFGRGLAWLFGGYDACLAVHKVGGLVLIGLFMLHVVYVLAAVPPRKWTGPDSMLPKPRDVGDFFRHLGWMLGLRKAPEFERWGYWEKFDYWAVFWGMVVIGGTGLLLYNPLATSRELPGWGLNVAFWIHRIEAVLAMLHVFIIHFLIAHLRRPSFPMDTAIFVGSVDVEHVKQERGAWLARLQRDDALAKLTAGAPGMALTIAGYVVGLAALASGIVLLVGGVVNAPYVTW